MDKTGSTSTLAPKTVHRQFFQWAVKWFYANVTEDISTKPDIPSIICLLQAAGFKLREFEKRDQLISNESAIKNENIKITMECGTSKMVAIMEMDDVKCECPKNNEEKDCSFWSVTGTEPMGSIDCMNKIEQTGSNLLPEMSKDTTALVRDIIYRLIKIINNKCDAGTDATVNLPAFSGNNTITKSTELKEGLVRSYTDYFDHKSSTLAKMNANLANARSNFAKNSKDSIHSDKPKFKRQGTYGVDESIEDEPRPSPPKVASSPVLHQLCTSLGQISLQSDEELNGLADYVVKAHQILDKAVNFIIKKIPSISSHSSINDEMNFVKPVPPSLMSSSFVIGSPRSSNSGGSLINRSMSSAGSSRPGSACSVASRSSIHHQDHAIPKPLARRSGTPNTLPPSRNRSSTLTQKTSPKTTALAATVRRKSSNAITSTGSAQRTSSVTSKLPTTKFRQNKTISNLSAEKMTMAKQRISPLKSQSTNPATHRGNVSLIKVPSRINSIGTTASNTSKFGFSAAKK